MPDASRVIEALECCMKPNGKCEACPYDGECRERMYALNNDIIALLKGQPTKAEIDGGGNTWYFVCGECHTYIDRRDKYCRECGRAIQWE